MGSCSSKLPHHVDSPPSTSPPPWEPAPERSHTFGLQNEATDDEYYEAERFCRENPVAEPRLLPSNIIDAIQEQGCRLWTLERPRSTRFRGSVQDVGEKSGPAVVEVRTDAKCTSVCLFSNLPLMAGQYEPARGKSGVYYEISVHRMDNGGIIAIGTACRPYPDWRFPGWQRLSAGVHLDDFRKFFEDPTGGRDCIGMPERISPGDTIGCGYDFSTSSVFFTYNGVRLPDAFTGVYLPRHAQDVYAAIGVEGPTEFEVNFGGDVFRWKEGNEWAWRVDGLAGRLADPSGLDAELPSYGETQAGSSRRR
ncbi:hypothetical protein OBBRIDRAFT_792119 [Obba rivulosa]|uniref:B30.2/SPRY domain-containing protein n=1 Tax=Obba rivulosa TaxID=1052685 RepID=A0A8E2DKM5_9APHY|nr:hypothetical protein OBBRIDRAFT_792119 [Obba rivulosa]